MSEPYTAPAPTDSDAPELRAPVTRGYRTVVPPGVCAALGLVPGDRIKWTLDGDRVRLERLPPAVLPSQDAPLEFGAT